MPHAETAPLATRVLIDAGMFIGALLTGHARHAVYTYDVDDWRFFADDGLRIVGPPSSMSQPSLRAGKS
jgi:hypothetical protein